MTVSMPAQALTLLLVDDHALVRDGLRRILAAHSPLWFVLDADSGQQALDCLRLHNVDMLITDLSMPGMNGLDLLRRAKLRNPGLHVLVLSMHEEEQYALRAFKAGAGGYLTKDCAAEELVAAVRKVAAGGAYVSGSLAEHVVQQLSGVNAPPTHSVLTDRELDILKRLVAGQRLTDIAETLHLSIKTISTHKSRIQEKLQLPNLTALVRYGLEHHLLDDDLTQGRGASIQSPSPPSDQAEGSA